MNLYSVPSSSRGLLKGVPDSSTTKKYSLEFREKHLKSSRKQAQLHRESVPDRLAWVYHEKDLILHSITSSSLSSSLLSSLSTSTATKTSASSLKHRKTAFGLFTGETASCNGSLDGQRNEEPFARLQDGRRLRYQTRRMSLA